MFPYTFEVVTAITLTVIAIILALYFIVLKRKGWLTEDSHGSYYRCPNPECRKIFDKPVAITDLSGENSKSPHSACPHCGLDLETVSSSVVTAKPSKPEMSTESMEISEKPTVAKDTKKLSTASLKSLQARPPGCAHFFGYLRKIPRNTPIPDECFSCPKMVECLSYDITE